jgi:5'-deoxynucleotidase YfbR-like HD superfamily hydrolase
MEHMASLASKGAELLSLWKRFETGTDTLAVLARELDKYQAVEKAFSYQMSYDIPVFLEFYEYEMKKKRITNPVLLERLSQMFSKHGEMYKNKTAE